MSHPIEVDLPHNLGKDEARRRIANNIHRLQDHIPGGAQVESGHLAVDPHQSVAHDRSPYPSHILGLSGTIQAHLLTFGM